MSVPFNPVCTTRRTDADMSSSPWLIVKANGDNDMDVAGAGDAPIGILTSNVVDATGLSPAEAYLGVQIGGIGKVKFGGAVTAGVSVKPDANGEAVAATTEGDIAIGYAWETAADGDLGSLIIARHEIGS